MRKGLSVATAQNYFARREKEFLYLAGGVNEMSEFRLAELRTKRILRPRVRDAVTVFVTMRELGMVLSRYCSCVFNLSVVQRRMVY